MSWGTDLPRPAAVALATVAVALVSACTPVADQEAGPTAAPTQQPGAATSRSPTPTASSPPEPSAVPRAATPSPSPTAVEIGLRIERRTDDDATATFTEDALGTLTDPRGWQRAGFRFVEEDDAPYLLVLAEADEVDRLCAPYDTGGRFSCQNGPVVALNADRWRTATEGWTGDLGDYRTYLVNHEVGHLLHLHHPWPQCPGEGLPAPVMLQQSTELGRCTANPWPLPWEVDLAAERREPLAPPADHEVDDHRPSPPPQQQDLDHRAVQS